MTERATRRHPVRTGIFLVLSALVAVPLFSGVYRALDLFGLPGALGILIALGVILSVAWIAHLFRTYGAGLVRIGLSIGRSVRDGLAANPFVSRAAGRLSRPARFVRRRLDPSAPSGLFLTGGITIALLTMVGFANITVQVLHRSPLAQADVRVASLSDLLHGGRPLRLATFFSLIGGAPFRIPLAILVFAAIWLRRPTLRPVAGLVIVLVVAPLASDLGRILVGRPRPPVGASALPGSSSYPSGHAAGAAGVFAYLAYLGARATRRLRTRIAISLLAAVATIGVAYSRVVLGFHWTSDVVAGTLLGFAVAAMAATWVGLRGATNKDGRSAAGRRPTPRALRLMALLGAIAVLALAGVDAVTHPRLAPRLLPPTFRPVAQSSVDEALLHRFPLHSETLTGRRMEPVSLVLVGSREQIEQAFEAAGWTEADPVGWHTLIRLYSAGLRHQVYPAAPVTPAFLNGRPQDLAFERATVLGSVGQRHHIRIWSSGSALADGSPVWLATASLDDRVEIKLTTLLPNHHIAPDIDTERDFIARQLLDTGLVREEAAIQAVPPELGTNAAGDPFFTYGKAVVIYLA